MAIEVAKVELKSVSDATGLTACIEAGQFGADDVVAVIGKTEGNGGVNDFTRILADQVVRHRISPGECRLAGSAMPRLRIFVDHTEETPK